jgi:flavin-dependent dehydrogenase
LEHQFDVAIFGAGPAALAVAARLLDSGREVALVDRSTCGRPWRGESFSGAIRGPLVTLGFWDEFANAGHVPGYERQSAWGSDPQCESSLIHPNGPMWHVDRDRFDADLRNAVRRRAATFLSYRKLGPIARRSGTWRMVLDQENELSARYLVDATGRSRMIAKRLGARITHHDRLIGLTAEVPHSQSSLRVASLMLQSTPFGWWYAAPVPGGHIVALFTDPDLASSKVRLSLRPVAANSAFTHMAGDEGWVAVGDACASHDPLCGWGVHRALSNGILAADAIDDYLRTGKSSSLDDYRRYCGKQFGEYLKGLTLHYAIERRWPNAPFWERRLNVSLKGE